MSVESEVEFCLTKHDLKAEKLIKHYETYWEKKPFTRLRYCLRKDFLLKFTNDIEEFLSSNHNQFVRQADRLFQALEYVIGKNAAEDNAQNIGMKVDPTGRALRERIKALKSIIKKAEVITKDLDHHGLLIEQCDNVVIPIVKRLEEELRLLERAYERYESGNKTDPCEVLGVVHLHFLFQLFLKENPTEKAIKPLLSNLFIKCEGQGIINPSRLTANACAIIGKHIAEKGVNQRIGYFLENQDQCDFYEKSIQDSLPPIHARHVLGL